MKAGKVLHIILIVLIVIFMSGHILLNNKKIQQDAASHVVRIAQSALGTDVSAGRVQLVYPFGITIDNLTVYDLSHDTLAHAASVSLRLKPWQLIRNKLSITSVRVNSPTLTLSRDSIGAEPNYAFLSDLFGGNSDPMALRANSVLIRNGSVRYDVLTAEHTDSLFNPNHIGVSGLTANVSIKEISEDSVSVIIRKFAFSEQSGFKLTRTKGSANIGRDMTRLSDITFTTPSSQLQIAHFFAAAGLASKITVIPQTDFDITATLTGSDFKAFLPQLSGMTDPIDVTIRGGGNDGQFTLNTLNVHTPHNYLDLDANGSISIDSTFNYTDFQYAHVNGTFNEGLPVWIENQLAGFGISLPSQCRSLGQGSLTAKLENRHGKTESDIRLESQIGSVVCDITGENSVFKGNLNATGLNLNTITGNKDLGSCSLTAQAEASRKDDGYHASIDGNVLDVMYKGYTYRDVAFAGNYSPEQIRTNIDFSDRNGALAVKAGMDKSDINSYSVEIGAESLNLAAYHLAGKDSMSISASVEANLAGRDVDDLTGKITVDSLYYADKAGDWSMDNMTAVISQKDDMSKIISVFSDFMSMTVEGDYRLSTLPGSLAKACADILPTIGKMVGTNLGARDYAYNTNDFTIEATILNVDFMDKVFHSPVVLNEPASLQMRFIDKDSVFTGHITIPYITVADERFTNGIIDINSVSGTCRATVTGFYGDEPENLTDINASFLAFTDIVRGNYTWSNPSGQMHGKLKTLSQFFRYDRQRGLKSLTFIDSTKITVNGTIWDVSLSRISTDMHKVSIADLSAGNDNQYIHADGTVSSDSSDVILLSINNIDLARTLSPFHVNDILKLGGIASGKVSIASVLNNPAFYGVISVDDFEFMNSYHGNLTADCRWNRESRQVEINGNMIQEGAEITGLTGIYIPHSKFIDVNIDADRTDLYFLNTWTKTVFSELGGRATGDIRIFGNLPHLDMEGQAILEDGYFVQDAVNTTFKIKHDTLWFEPGRMNFKDVEFYDAKGHDGILTCIIRHENFKKWRVDMTADVADMQVFYQPKNERSDIFASVFAEGTMSLTFNERRGLAISVNARTAPGTRISYSPSSGTVADYNFLTIVDRGVVKIDEETVKNILPDNNKKKKNFSLDFNIECSEDALIEMSMNSLNGFFRGNGNVSLKYSPKDGPVLNGIYNLSYGQCALSVEDLIRKNFTLMEGSYVRFNGAPMDTELNLQTYHNVNSASIYDLDPSASSTNKVHVRCLMDITGNVSDPRISFDIDMPNGTPEEKAVLASATATEEQRNIQFMYLLAIGRFYTYDVAAMNNGLTPSTMESIVNSTVSGQINNLLSQVLDNEKVSISSNVSASSYLTNDATNLSNKELEGILEAHLLNNRLLVNGNFGYRENTINNTSNFIGDFEFKYLLIPDKNGKGISIKGYNKANDKYFSKATLTTQGVGLVFEKDF